MAAAAAIAGNGPGIVLDYHSLLLQPREQVQRLYRRLQDIGVGGLREPDDEEIAAWIGPDLARQRHARAASPSDTQQALWQALQQRAAGVDAPLPALSVDSVALLRQVAQEHRARMRAEQEPS